MKLKAPAKLNLYLEIKSKLPNGYHELESEVVFLDLADEILIEPSDKLTVIGTNFPDEITLMAANLMQLEFGITQGAKISITKNIPSGGGLGGGSADAAATIIGLKGLWNINCGDKKLYELALKLGADVPACLYHQLTGKSSVKFSGIGEILEEAQSKKDLYFVLVNPNKSLSTKDVFMSLEFSKENSQPKENHLENTAINLMPEIGDILKALKNTKPQIARMTGSGATCFGIYDSLQESRKAEEELKSELPDFWIKTTELVN